MISLRWLSFCCTGSKNTLMRQSSFYLLTVNHKSTQWHPEPSSSIKEEPKREILNEAASCLVFFFNIFGSWNIQPEGQDGAVTVAVFVYEKFKKFTTTGCVSTILGEQDVMEWSEQKTLLLFLKGVSSSAVCCWQDRHIRESLHLLPITQLCRPRDPFAFCTFCEGSDNSDREKKNWLFEAVPQFRSSQNC